MSVGSANNIIMTCEPSFVGEGAVADAPRSSLSSSIQPTVQSHCADIVTGLSVATSGENNPEQAHHDLNTAMQNMTIAKACLQEAETELSKAMMEGGLFCRCWKVASGRTRRAEILVKQAERQYRDAQQVSSEERHKETRRDIQGIRQEINTLVRSFTASTPTALNPWGKMKLEAQSERPETLRKEMAIYYGVCEVVNEKVIAKCFLTGQKGDGKKVTAAHLLPRHASPEIVRSLDVPMVDHPRNVIFLCLSIEKAFDDLKLCFLADGLKPRSFTLKIWEERTKHQLLFHGSTQTIGEFDGKSMKFPKGKAPFSRVLSLHAQWSYKQAVKKRWVSHDESKPEKYGSPVQDDTISIVQMQMNATSTTSNPSSPSTLSWTSPQPSVDDGEFQRTSAGSDVSGL